MESETKQPELAEAYLRGLLASLGLDVNYVRAEGNTLYYLNGSGEEVAVADFVGGYGSLMLGHNNPDIISYATELLSRQVPIHAQFSYHPYANDLALALNRIIWREFGTEERYRAIFASTGAEAIETAMKHAEMDRGLRVGELAGEISEHVAAARAAIDDGSAAVAQRAFDQLGVDGSGEGAFGRLAEALQHANETQFARQPLFLALEDSFHGKLAGSLQLTHNSGYRLPFRALAAQARFAPFDQPNAIKKILDEERAVVFDLSLEDGVVDLVTRDFPAIAGFFVEPIQGEGGIKEVSEQLAREIREAADAGGFPVIIDEIQCGMGRSGAFFASSQIGLRGDYYVLAKSIGGGVAKSSVLLIRESRYRTDFELLHSSTFAKDAFSCHIGNRVVQLLEADEGRIYHQAKERGAYLSAMLSRVGADYPEVVKEVRGRGLMLGMEFQDQTQSADQIIGEYAKVGLIGYIFAGYLLREHSVRVFPTASAPHTLRFEPSVGISDAEIAQLETALRALCAVVRDQSGPKLVGAP